MATCITWSPAGPDTESTRSLGTPRVPCPRPCGRRGSPQPRAPRPGSGSSRRVRSRAPRLPRRTLTFPVRPATGQGREPRVLLNSPWWERPRFARTGRTRDPAPSGRRALAAVGGTGRSAGPPSAGSPGRKGHCPEPPSLVPGSAWGATRRSADPRADPPVSRAAAGDLAGAPRRPAPAKRGEKPGATCTFRVRPSCEAVERGEGEGCG